MPFFVRSCVSVFICHGGLGKFTGFGWPRVTCVNVNQF